MDDWVTVAFQYGFPAVITTYMVVVMNKSINNLTQAVVALTTLVEEKLK